MLKLLIVRFQWGFCGKSRCSINELKLPASILLFQTSWKTPLISAGRQANKLVVDWIWFSVILVVICVGDTLLFGHNKVKEANISHGLVKTTNGCENKQLAVNKLRVILVSPLGNLIPERKYSINWSDYNNNIWIGICENHVHVCESWVKDLRCCRYWLDYWTSLNVFFFSAILFATA